jgi:zinc protease
MIALLLAAAPALPVVDELAPLTVGAHTFQRRELANGLRAVAVRDELETVSVFMTVGVGGRQETPETTGLAHLVEHAMFTGTPSTGTDEHERKVEAFGGESNAFTRDDYTVYYDHAFAPEHLEAVLAMEADRLVHLTLDEAPVLHERHRLELEEAHTYQPSEGRAQELEAAVFCVHPYRAGLRDAAGHTRAPTLSVAAIRAFYERYYHPNNVSVVVVGPRDPGAALDAIEAAFGGLARGPALAPPAVEPWFAARTARLVSTLPRDRHDLAWLVPERGHAARPALEVLAKWCERQELADGRPVQASCGERIDRDLFRVSASGADASAGLAELVAAARAGSGPAEADVAEVVAALARDVEELPLRARPYFSLAGTFGVYEVQRQAALLPARRAALAAVTPAAIRAAAARYLAPERCVTVVFTGTGAPIEPLPTDPQALHAAAIEAAETGDHERAIEAFTRLLAAHPNRMNTVIYLATRGQVHADRRDYDAAIADYEAALAVVEYPAVRTLLEEALARKSAVMRGELEDDDAPVPPASGGDGDSGGAPELTPPA